MKTYRIKICSTVDLYLDDNGFAFTNEMKKPKILNNWEQWQYSWQPYTRDNIYNTIMNFVDMLPDTMKSHIFYQELKFKVS